MSRDRIFPLIDRPRLFGDREPDRYHFEDIGEEMLDLTEKHAISYEKKRELVEDTSDRWRMEPWEAEETFAEYGAPICLRRGYLTIPEGETGHGTSTYISRNICKEKGGKFVGGFHTHPVPPITPSNPDLRLMRKHGYELACIGTIAGDEAVVICFEEPEEQTRGGEWMEARRVIKSFYTGDKEDPDVIGEINMWEDTSPTPRQILDEQDYIIKEVAEHEDVTEQELIDELKRGQIPEEIGRGMMEVSTQEKVDLPIYTKEREVEELEKDLRRMRRNFDNVTVFRRNVYGQR